MSRTVNLYNAGLELDRLTEQAVNNKIIKKPIAWALYQTWKWADKNEKPRMSESEEKA